MPVRNQRHQDRNQRRRIDADKAEHIRDVAREMNALRQDYRGRPVDEIRAMLQERYAGEFDRSRLDACADAIAADREIRL